MPLTCVVLYYHEVRLSHRERFAKQMDKLIQWAKPVRADNTVSLERGVHHVVVTFDDGFQSVVENAIPELISRNIPSTIFIPTGFIGQSPGWDVEPDYSISQEKIVTEQQIRELPLDLVSIGSHSITHSKLTFLEENEAKKELNDSRSKLESISGCDVTLFSCPHGDFNHRLVKLAHEVGYKRFFTSVPGLALMDSHEYVTCRVPVNPTDWQLEFTLKLVGAYSWLPLMTSLKNKIRDYICSK